MLVELQSLASALIKTEKRSCKQKTEWKDKQLKMKEIIQNQEDCIGLLDA